MLRGGLLQSVQDVYSLSADTLAGTAADPYVTPSESLRSLSSSLLKNHPQGAWRDPSSLLPYRRNNVKPMQDFTGTFPDLTIFVLKRLEKGLVHFLADFLMKDHPLFLYRVPRELQSPLRALLDPGPGALEGVHLLRAHL